MKSASSLLSTTIPIFLQKCSSAVPLGGIWVIEISLYKAFFPKPESPYCLLHGMTCSWPSRFPSPVFRGFVAAYNHGAFGIYSAIRTSIDLDECHEKPCSCFAVRGRAKWLQIANSRSDRSHSHARAEPSNREKTRLWMCHLLASFEMAELWVSCGDLKAIFTLTPNT